ncbi:MAG: sulfurtransferase TusA family protein [Hyphomicrobiales bacterium]
MTEKLDLDIETLDVRGLLCPLPVLKARKRLSTMPANAVLRIEATDPATVIDIPHYCQESGNTLLNHSEESGLHIFTLKKTG